MTFEEFRWVLRLYPHPQWRAGQDAFNALDWVRADLSELVRGGRFDPYYDDKRLPTFWTFVEAEWTPPDA